MTIFPSEGLLVSPRALSLGVDCGVGSCELGEGSGLCRVGGAGVELWCGSLASEDHVFPPMLAGPRLLVLAKVEESIC